MGYDLHSWMGSRTVVTRERRQREAPMSGSTDRSSSMYLAAAVERHARSWQQENNKAQVNQAAAARQGESRRGPHGGQSLAAAHTLARWRGSWWRGAGG